MAQTTEYQVTRHELRTLRVIGARRGRRSSQGVERIEVSAATGRLVVESAAPLDDADVIAAVDEAGYEAVRV